MDFVDLEEVKMIFFVNIEEVMRCLLELNQKIDFHDHKQVKRSAF